MQDRNQDFASTAMLALAIKVLSKLNPQLVLADTTVPDYLSKANTQAQSKSAVLRHALEVGGIGPLLWVGQEVSQLAKLPRFEALLRSRDSDILRHKWMRLERYFHYAHRTKITAVDSNQWHCLRYHKRGIPPLPENLLICGMMLGLLNAFGLKLVQCNIGSVSLPLSRGQLDKNKLLKLPITTDNQADQWSIRWQKVDVIKPTGSEKKSADAPICAQLSSILEADISAHLRVEHAATLLGLSNRSLQRWLKSEGHSFSSVVRGARIQSACQMLSQTDTSIADIGFCCGFTDQAHFGRNFKTATNMTPANYRLL